MNDQFEFLKYEATPGERHHGVATVRLYGKVILRYKIVPTKDGMGFFPAAASYKMPSLDGVNDHYVQAFMLDSNSEKETLETLIRDRVKPHVDKVLGNVIGDRGDPLKSQQAHPGYNNPSHSAQPNPSQHGNYQNPAIASPNQQYWNQNPNSAASMPDFPPQQNLDPRMPF